MPRAVYKNGSLISHLDISRIDYPRILGPRATARYVPNSRPAFVAVSVFEAVVVAAVGVGIGGVGDTAFVPFVAVVHLHLPSLIYATITWWRSRFRCVGFRRIYASN